MKLDKIDPVRMIAFRVELAMLGGKMVQGEHAKLVIECPADRAEEVRQLAIDFGIVLP